MASTYKDEFSRGLKKENKTNKGKVEHSLLARSLKTTISPNP